MCVKLCDMKASLTAPTLPIPNPDDWCSVAWAAKRINRSERTVRRLASKNVLRIHHPRVVSSGEKADMLWVADVEAYREALMTAGQLLTKTGWRKGERG